MDIYESARLKCQRLKNQIGDAAAAPGTSSSHMNYSTFESLEESLEPTPSPLSPQCSFPAVAGKVQANPFILYIIIPTYEWTRLLCLKYNNQ